MSFINWGSESSEQLKIRKKLEEQMMLEQAAYYASMAAAAAAGSGGKRLSSNTIEFVLTTADWEDFQLNVEVTDDTTYTVIWGDGTTQDLELMSNVVNTIEHTYAETGEYLVRMSFADPSLVRELDFPGDTDDYASLTSIIGLQNLTELVEFRADWNKLDTIDLSGLTNLVYVDISDNDRLGSNGLTSINLSGCTALEQLYLDDNDFSGGFPDLSGLTALVNIDFDQCGITGSINISNLPLLERFDFNGNTGLTELIISSSQPLGDNNNELNVEGCALTQTSVNNILVALAANDIDNGYINLSGGTNAAPSGAGAAALVTLEEPAPGKNWSADVN